MPKRPRLMKWLAGRPGDSPRQSCLSGLLVAVMGGVLTSRLVLALFDMESLFTSWLSLSTEGLSSLFLFQVLTHLFIPGSFGLFALCALLFYLAGRPLELLISRQNFVVMLLAWTFLGGLAELVLNSDAIVKANASLAVGALCAYAIAFPDATWKTRWFSLPLAPLAATSAAWIIVRTAIERAVPGIPTPQTILAPLAAQTLVAAFTAVYVRFLGLGRPTSIELKLAAARFEQLRFQSLSPHAFIEEFVDPILEKISATGMKSLTRRERNILKISRDKLVKAGLSGNDRKQSASEECRPAQSPQRG